MNFNKKYLSYITSFSSLDANLHTHSMLFEKLSKNFEKIFIINPDNLKFFSKKNDNYKFYSEVNKLPSNFVLFNPKNSKEFSKFLEDKKILVINNFGRSFFSLKLHLLLKKHKVQQILISNIGALGETDTAYLKHLFRFLFFHFNKTLSEKLILLLSNLGIVSKIDIQFISNKTIVDNVKKGFLYKNNFLFVKKLILVNSRGYDIYLEKRIPVSEDYIVHLDASLNYHHETQLRGKLNEETVAKHYYYLEKFLKKLSSEFNKEVLVCIHPRYDIKEQQNYFKDFKVLKFKTRESIYKSFLVTTFDTGAVADAILLKKKILGFISDFMTRNEIEHAKNYASRVGYLKLNTRKDYLFNREKILFQMNKNLSNYEKYISNYHCFEPNKLGTNKIIKIIKEKFFNVETS